MLIRTVPATFFIVVIVTAATPAALLFVNLKLGDEEQKADDGYEFDDELEDDDLEHDLQQREDRQREDVRRGKGGWVEVMRISVVVMMVGRRVSPGTRRWPVVTGRACGWSVQGLRWAVHMARWAVVVLRGAVDLFRGAVTTGGTVQALGGDGCVSVGICVRIQVRVTSRLGVINGLVRVSYTQSNQRQQQETH